MGIDNEGYMDSMIGCSVPIVNSEVHFIASLNTYASVIRKSLEGISNLVNSPITDSGE